MQYIIILSIINKNFRINIQRLVVVTFDPSEDTA